MKERIIPALAGNTIVFLASADLTTDHPRSRGEYADDPGTTADLAGSSPLSRGIHPRRWPPRGQQGIIPALAGNTPSRGSSTTPSGDHPRSRGEYQLLGRMSRILIGSSPLSRGILSDKEVDLSLVRIIPALAGNTPRRYAARRRAWDHPRSRGEYPSMTTVATVSSGSSPLSRGIRRAVLPARALSWIIPALAGNTVAG